MPKLSIITVNLNNAKGLQKTIDSVVNQTFSDFEYLIIDGGSTDTSKEIIKKYASKITYWSSEPDSGIYNGMNKGIKQAKGEYCLFLNSGDNFVENNSIKKAFSTNFNENVVYGNIIVNLNVIKYPNKLDLLHFIQNSLPHPASFIKRELFLKYGFYNEANKIVSDWEFFIDIIIKHKLSYKQLPITISNFDYTGISSQEKSRTFMLEERENILKNKLNLILENYSCLAQENKKYKASRLV